MVKKILSLLVFISLRTIGFDDESKNVYNTRYPAIFKTFLENTNEKIVDADAISRISNIIAQARPEWLQKNPYIYDIGCGDGLLSNLVLEKLQRIAPLRTQFIGIDPQEELLEKAKKTLQKISWITPTYSKKKFEDINATDTSTYPAADMLILSQCFYYMKDIPSCIHTMKQLMAPNGCAFLIHVNTSALHELKKHHKNIIESTSVDLLGIIEKALDENNLAYVSFELPVTIAFPKLSDALWNRLYEIPFGSYTNDYLTYGHNFIAMKSLFELFFEHPLESFSYENRKVLLDNLKTILQKRAYRLTIYYRMHVVFKQAIPSALIEEAA